MFQARDASRVRNKRNPFGVEVQRWHNPGLLRESHPGLVNVIPSGYGMVTVIGQTGHKHPGKGRGADGDSTLQTCGKSTAPSLDRLITGRRVSRLFFCSSAKALRPKRCALGWPY